MPLRQEILKQRWATFDLPIPPFLAPRAFSPWPSGHNRARQSTSAAPAVRLDQEPLCNLASTPANEGFAAVPLGEVERAGSKGRQRTSENPNSSADSRNPRYFNPIIDKETVTLEPFKKQTLSTEGKDFSGVLFPRARTARLRQSAQNPSKIKVKQASLKQSKKFREKYKEIWGTYEDTQAEGNMGIRRDTSTMEQLDGRIIGSPSPALSVPKSTPSIRKNTTTAMAARKRFAIGRINHISVEKITGVRPKLVRWNPATESPGLSWHTSFAALNYRNESFMSGQKHPELLLQANRSLPVAFGKVLIQHGDSASLRATWEMLSETDRIKVWPELMITVLQNYPDSALKVLVATHSNPPPPEYAVVDCLQFITSHYFRKRNNVKDVDIKRILEAIVLVAQNGKEGRLALSQHSIYLLVSNLSLEDTRWLYLSFARQGLELHENTLMHFATVFVKSDEVDLAFKILTRLRKQGANFSSASMSSLCVLLLDRRHRLDKENYTDVAIFEYMLESGLKPNIVIYNVLIHNSLQRGDHETGWRIHNMLIKNGNEADEYTYSLLLNDAKIRLDTSDIRRVSDLVTRSKIRNAHIMTDILHAAYLLHRQEHELRKLEPSESLSTAFETMLPMYCEHFENATLFRLIPMLKEQASVIPERSNHPPTTDFEGSIPTMKTPYPTLVVMVTAYLQEVSHPHEVLDLYRIFRQLLRHDDEEGRMLLSTTHIYNAILMSLGKFRETLSMCSQVIEDMLNDATNSQLADHKAGAVHPAISERKPAIDHSGEADTVAYSPSTIAEQTVPSTIDGSLPYSGCGTAPTVQTWSILLNIFMVHRQPLAAEKVLDLMTSRGITPNLVTWNILCSGYARLQDSNMAVDVIKRLEQAGLVTDEYTIRGLSRLEDRRALIEVMRKKEEMMLITEEESRNTETTLESLQNALDADKKWYERFSDEDVVSRSPELDALVIGDIKTISE